MNILLTAIGSMSAKCAINQLKTTGHNIIGCDIYPKEWHTESKLCDYFYQAPYATDEEKYCVPLNFNKYFYKPAKLREAREIVDSLKSLDREADKMMSRIMEGLGA